MTIYDFMSESPYLTFFLAVIVAIVVQFIFTMVINRSLRHMNIRKHGWPPEHCDADGDFKQQD